MDRVKIQIQGISKQFTRPDGVQLTVLSGINLECYEGEFLAIVGPSGCGKTTLLRIINGLIKPSEGTVFLDGRAWTRPGPQMGFVFQQGNLFPWRSVLANVTLGLELQGIGRAEAREQAWRLIRLVGLEGFDGYYPYQISGGMQQRVNLARALVVDPEVLLMDEPFASLDAQTREFMQQELLRIWNAQKKTVAFVTHQIDEAVYLADRVVVMGRGPGRVREIVRVDIPRPRGLHVKRTPWFLEYVDHIWTEIEDEVRQTGGFSA